MSNDIEMLNVGILDFICISEKCRWFQMESEKCYKIILIKYSLEWVFEESEMIERMSCRLWYL